MQAHLLSLDKFGMPKVLDKSNAEYTNIVYLLLLDPGKFQSHPNMGVGLRSKYRFNNEDGMMYNLSMDIKEQLETYLPELQFTNVELALKDSTLCIAIDTNEGIYAIGYDTETSAIDIAARYVLDQL